MRPIGFHPEARLEFLESARYYENEQTGLGQRFFEAVRAAITLLEKYLDLGREVEPGIRRCRVVRFPYGIIYRVSKESIEIVAVMHLRRRPGYWRERVEE